MNQLDDRVIKERLKQMLVCFAQICESNDLYYSLSGGTLLGAIRHKGFIPWDDDIDVSMPRKDYEKLLVIAPPYLQEHRYAIRAGGLNGNYDYPYARILDLRAIVRSKYICRNKFLWIDIFPIDGLPEDIAEAKKLFAYLQFQRRILILAKARLGEGQTLFRKIFKFIPKTLAVLYGAKRVVAAIEKISRKYPYDECQYVGDITWGLIGERMLKAEFEKSVEVEFEGHKFKAFSCWDSYLTGQYGDYRQLPPIEQRKTHDLEVWIKE